MIKIAKTLLSRIWWLGRGTATVMGLAMLIALTIGLASTALAGTGVGARFDLGQPNVVDAVSELRGSIRGPMLSITNQNTGKVCDEPATERLAARSTPGEPPTPPGPVPIPSPCTTSPAPALGLNVSSGQTPMTVNPSAGTATNLSADELDGKDSSSFASATNGKANDADKLDGVDSSGFLRTNGKAADADKLDGKDSSAFLGPRFYTVKGSEGLVGTGGGQLKNRSATCDSGDLAIGGFYDTQPGDVVFETYTFPGLIGSSGSSFAINVQDNGAGNLMSATAVCADNPPFH